MKGVTRIVTAILVAVAASGCFLFTEPKPLIDAFTWEGIENQSEVTEGVTVAALFRDISFLGQVKTPTLCYSVGAKLEVNGTTLTVRVDLTSTGSGTCTQQAGGFRYSGSIQNLDPGTYTVRVIQKVTGQAEQEFTHTVKL